uniref:Uncharacterized protein n=1 Tax=mine drainage metagenome TaxID=410659 RepID=E6QFC4_9ZZZZ
MSRPIVAAWAQRFICCHFNPLEEVRVGTEWEVRDVMNIAMMIVDQNGKSLSDHHQKNGLRPC